MLWLKNLNKQKIPEGTIAFFFYALLLFKTLECFIPMSHGDALSYHLVIAKLILERGFINAHNDFYLGNIAGFFDYLYVIPQWLVGSKLLAHVLSQFLHTTVSLFLSIYIFSKCLKKKHKAIFYLSGISLLTFARGPDFFIYAKNDGALATTFLTGTLLVFNKIGSTLPSYKKAVLIGITLGLLPIIKMSGIIYSLTLGLYFLFKNKNSLNSVAITSLVSISVTSLILIKNWIFVGNPLFPAFLELFPTKASPEMISFMNSMLKRPANIIGIWQNYFVAFSPKMIGFIAIPAFIYNFRNNRPDANHFIFLILLFTTLYCFINPGYPAERFYFGCHFVLLYYLFETLTHYIKGLETNKSLVLFLILILVIADSKIDKVIKRNTQFYPQAFKHGLNKEILHFYIPHTKIWDHVSPNSNILSDFISMQYYAPQGSLLYQSGHSREADFLKNCHTPEPTKLKKFQFLILNSELNKCQFFSKIKKELIFTQGKYELYRL